jgi:hypothetical protein
LYSRVIGILSSMLKLSALLLLAFLSLAGSMLFAPAVAGVIAVVGIPATATVPAVARGAGAAASFFLLHASDGGLAVAGFHGDSTFFSDAFAVAVIPVVAGVPFAACLATASIHAVHDVRAIHGVRQVAPAFANVFASPYFPVIAESKKLLTSLQLVVSLPLRALQALCKIRVPVPNTGTKFNQISDTALDLALLNSIWDFLKSNPVRYR